MRLGVRFGFGGRAQVHALRTRLSEVDGEGAIEPADEVDDVVGGAVEGEGHVEGAAWLGLGLGLGLA